MVEWSRALGGVPIHLHAADRQWVMRADPANAGSFAAPSCAPSWPAPAADRVNVRESLFAAAFNGLLQQNLPGTDMALFDHLVGNRHNSLWHFNTESLGYLEVAPSRAWLSSGTYSATLLR